MKTMNGGVATSGTDSAELGCTIPILVVAERRFAIGTEQDFAACRETAEGIEWSRLAQQGISELCQGLPQLRSAGDQNTVGRDRKH
jgi:hypothetical protein